MKAAGLSDILQLKINLRYIRPPIWRRVQVPGDFTLAKLHRVVQAVMGWQNYHLFQFTVGKTFYGDPSLDEFSELDLKDARKARVGQILSKPKQRMVYEYDFGDGWKHDIVFETVLPPDSNTRYPFCLEGARACPPEDCGGVRGYEYFLEAIFDPDHEEHDEMLEWVGGEFDPEKFDIMLANRELKRIK